MWTGLKNKLKSQEMNSMHIILTTTYQYTVYCCSVEFILFCVDPDTYEMYLKPTNKVKRLGIKKKAFENVLQI